MTRPIPHRSPARTRQGALANLELEFIEERASALGRAGKRLERVLEQWHRLEAAGEATEAEIESTLEAVAEATYALVVQRDCAGFRINNLQWIRRYYDIPEAALRRM